MTAPMTEVQHQRFARDYYAWIDAGLNPTAAYQIAGGR